MMALSWRQEAPAAPTHDMGPALMAIVTAARPIRRGEVIAPADLAPGRMEPPLPAAAYTTSDSIIGSMALRDIAPGQIVVAADIEAVTAGSGLAALIPPGRQAVALRVDDEVAVGSFLSPGDHVDVKWVRPQGAGVAAQTLLADTLVLSAGDTLAAQPTGTARRMQTITLAVTPEGAQSLAVARETGHFYLALRRPGDDTPAAGSSPGLGASGRITLIEGASAAEIGASRP